MSTSVGMKAGKKQPAISNKLSAKSQPRTIPAELKISLLSIENACMRILESDYAGSGLDADGLYWQQRLMNIAKPVSLALAELSGPRHFHGHYRHRKDDDSVLHPVLEDPVEALAQACQHALKACTKLAGMQDDSLLRAQSLLENTLQGFLIRYKKEYSG
jgi:hypothetical protein